MNSLIAEKLTLLPSSPGVYKMFNAEGEVIYVGKAVNLKNRVSQYFHASKNHSPKVLAMVSHVSDFETIQVSNETEAFSLESNLIKQFRPKYNILLKDDKHFPYVRVDLRQPYPRLETVRRIRKDGAEYLGPYLSSVALGEALDVVREHFPLRHCKKDLNAAIARRERPCLMYHLGKCCAPCSGNVTPEEYHAMLREVLSFLGGNSENVIRELTRRMEEASESMAFEQAAKLRDSIRTIQKMKEKQSVINTRHTVADVFALGRQDTATLIFALFVRDGKVIGTERFRMENAAEDENADILEAFLLQYYDDSQELPREIMLTESPAHMEELEQWLKTSAGRRVPVTVPRRGEKAALTALALRNALDTLEKDASLQRREWERGEGALAQLTGLLDLDEIPSRIECFDNSHFRGRDTVSSMVVFADGQPDKKAYRRFRLQPDTGGDDLKAMEEALTRRFQRYADGDAGFSSLPGLLLIDGGLTQLAVAERVLSAFGLSHIPAAALAEQRELLYLPDREEPLALPKNSAPLHLVERIRDEAHRFAITYHRNLRSKAQVFSELDRIPGIGDKRKRALFDRYLTLEEMKAASIEDLVTVPGMTKASADALYRFFHGEEN